MRDVNGYTKVTIYYDNVPGNSGYAYRAIYGNGHLESGAVGGANIDEALTQWLEEHVGYGGRLPPTTIKSTSDGARVLEWL